MRLIGLLDRERSRTEEDPEAVPTFEKLCECRGQLLCAEPDGHLSHPCAYPSDAFILGRTGRPRAHRE